MEVSPAFGEAASSEPVLAPDLRDAGRPKSVKWHRLDYYEIAPLTDGENEKAGVLSRGALVSRVIECRCASPRVSV